MERKSLKVKVQFTEPLLATASGNQEIYEEFIAVKAPGGDKVEEELDSLPKDAQIEKASTVFHRDDKGLFLYDYTWRGFIKERIGHLCELGEFKKLSKWTFKRAVDGAVFVNPRRIYITRGGQNLLKPDGTIQRPLRASTMQGDRVALARSEFVKDCECAFEVTVLESSNGKSAWKEIDAELIKTCLTMGQQSGHGQWRSGGYGRFTWSEG